MIVHLCCTAMQINVSLATKLQLRNEGRKLEKMAEPFFATSKSVLEDIKEEAKYKRKRTKNTTIWLNVCNHWANSEVDTTRNMEHTLKVSSMSFCNSSVEFMRRFETRTEKNRSLHSLKVYSIQAALDSFLKGSNYFHSIHSRQGVTQTKSSLSFKSAIAFLIINILQLCVFFKDNLCFRLLKRSEIKESL